MAELTHDQARRIAEFVARLEAATAELGVEIAYCDRTMVAIDGDPVVYLTAQRGDAQGDDVGPVVYVIDTRDA